MSDNLDLFHSIIIYFRKISNRKEVAVIYRKFIAQVARKKVELRLKQRRPCQNDREEEKHCRLLLEQEQAKTQHSSVPSISRGFEFEV